MTSSDLTFQTSALKSDADYLAPDGSEIRLLPTMKGGGLCHCTLPAGKTSSPVFHLNVEEIWYVIEGQGEVWRKAGELEDLVRVSAGTSLTIPPRTSFQFRNTGPGPLCILIVTMPPWPGPQEAVDAIGAWPAVARFDAGDEHPSDVI
jgi:mannose-6-phosphate isomerase-like protein (cupin superfamily)